MRLNLLKSVFEKNGLLTEKKTASRQVFQDEIDLSFKDEKGNIVLSPFRKIYRDSNLIDKYKHVKSCLNESKHFPGLYESIRNHLSTYIIGVDFLACYDFEASDNYKQVEKKP